MSSLGQWTTAAVRSARAAHARGTLVRGIRRNAMGALARPIIERYGYPSFSDLLGQAGGAWSDVETLVQHLFSARVPFPIIQGEFADLRNELDRRRTRLGLVPYPAKYAVEEKTALFLYATVRLTVPMHLLETGVANGNSSFLVLEAMQRNEVGILHSIDVGRQAGQLVGADERSRWDLRILRTANLRAEVRRLIRSLPELDVFVHDSDHSRAWQTFEYGLAEGRIRAGGFLMSDDIDASFAFARFCRKRSLVPELLIDGRKMFGVVRV